MSDAIGWRRASPSDQNTVVNWLSTPEDCSNWAGPRVAFPIKLEGLANSLEWESADSFTLTIAGGVAGFGQVVPKERGRKHLAHIIVDPERRGEGLGRSLSTNLLAEASKAEGCVSLNVAPDNVAAIALYTSLGFSIADRPADEPVSDATYMEL